VDTLHINCPEDLGFLRPKIVEKLDRIGNETDGGYAISRSAIEKSDALLSLGLGENWSFEKSFSEINEKAVIDIYDDTVSLTFFIKKVFKGLVKVFLFQDSNSNFIARLSKLNDYFSFWIRNPNMKHHQIRIDKVSFLIALNKYSHDKKLGLKIDIEGSEWEILDLIAQNKDRFEFVLLEIHNFDQHVDQLRDFLNDFSERFILVHLHANNFESVGSNGFPKVFEITLLSTPDPLTSYSFRSELPIAGLDAPNARNRPDYAIKFQ
jgi:hypothetical protein